MNTNKRIDEVSIGGCDNRNRGVIHEVMARVQKLQKRFGVACRSSEFTRIRVNSCSFVVRLY